MLKKILILILFIQQIAWAQSKTDNPSFRPLESFEQIFAKAAKEKKPVFFEAYLPTCSHCMAYDKTLRDPKIKSYLSTNFLAYQLDLSKRENGLFLRKNKIFVPSTPSFIVFSPEGQVINVEPVGDETNSVDGIVALLNKAKDLNRNAIASLKKFDAGNQDFENMLSVALFARYTMDTVKNMEVVNKLANSIQSEQYLDKMSFLLMQRVMLDTDNKLFQFFIQNLPAYKQKFDSLEVKQAAENILMSSLYCSRARKYSTGKIDQIKNGLRLLGVPENQIATRCIVLEVLIDLGQQDIPGASKKIKTYYNGKTIPEKEMDFWCTQLKRNQKAEMPCPLSP
jgi:hypothetical protein